MPFLGYCTKLWVMDEFSWTGGCAHASRIPWSRSGDNLERAGVHQLWRLSELPEAELRHMGATTAMLSDAPTPLAARHVAPVLGRIVLDAEYNDSGERYTSADKRRAIELGRTVIERFFA